MKVMDDKATQAVFDIWNLDVLDAFLIEGNNQTKSVDFYFNTRNPEIGSALVINLP
jgi:hypothetical protein